MIFFTYATDIFCISNKEIKKSFSTFQENILSQFFFNLTNSHEQRRLAGEAEKKVSSTVQDSRLFSGQGKTVTIF